MDDRQRRRIEPVGPARLTARTGDTSRIGSGNRIGSAAQRLRDSRKARHSGIFAAVHRLDAGLDQATREQLAAWVGDQYAVDYGDIPVGFVATCHLGLPYVDHRLDLVFAIVDHFAPNEPMPEPFARARMMVRTGAYEFVEVYGGGRLVPVLADGTAVTS